MANKRFAIKCSRSTFFIAAYAFLLILTSTFFLRLLLKEAIRMAQLPSDAGIVSVVPPSQSREEIDVYVLAIESLIPKNQKRMRTLKRVLCRACPDRSVGECTNEFRIKCKWLLDAEITSVVPPSQSREEIDVYVLAFESLIPKNQKRMGTLNRFIYRVCTNEFRIKYKCCTIQLCVFAPLWLFFFRAILLSLNFLFSLYFIYLPL